MRSPGLTPIVRWQDWNIWFIGFKPHEAMLRQRESWVYVLLAQLRAHLQGDTKSLRQAPGRLEASVQIAAEDALGAGELVGHVAAVSVLMVLGKCFPIFCYRQEASLRTRVALSLGMCARG